MKEREPGSGSDAGQGKTRRERPSKPSDEEWVAMSGEEREKWALTDGMVLALERARQQTQAELEPQVRAFKRVPIELAIAAQVSYNVSRFTSGWFAAVLSLVGILAGLSWLVASYLVAVSPREPRNYVNVETLLLLAVVVLLIASGIVYSIGGIFTPKVVPVGTV